MSSQSLGLDDKYPHQSRESAYSFNEHIIAYLQEKPFPIYILDQHNLTMDAQTSDGFHYLSDVNLLKVYFIIHLSTQIKQEQELEGQIYLNTMLNQTKELNASSSGNALLVSNVSHT